ncbi:DUF6292 family protein [Lentzea cavernae]|uniref:DUF6292 domain-containing protein n=1 Tax=Lentzea cavernae TaxID=2020703 RepID=A0ABQ3MEN2_9PSEU|nr:DUF6292 family protein [Lentzea cavernae]GHH39880.1 hypothetical protein GCM10017774_32260 [Lentzea cavernae]
MTQTTPDDDEVLSGREGAPVATSQGTHLLAGALDRYVHAVAAALDVPSHGISFEVTDTATAYIALGCRAPEHPDRDVMLVWSATQGWAVSIETDPAEPRIVLGRSTGDVVQDPESVARLVAESVRGARAVPASITLPVGWSDLAERMDRYTP